MGRFDDQLWADLVDEHGPALAVAQRATPPRGRGRPRVLAAVGAFGLVGVVTAVALTLTVTGASPAFAVTRNADGTVTVTIRQIEGVSGANAELARLGVRARAVTPDPGCTSDPVRARVSAFAGGALRPGGGQDAVTISPGLIPVHETLVLVAEQISGGRTAMAAFMVVGSAPNCYDGKSWRIAAISGGSRVPATPPDTGSAPADTGNNPGHAGNDPASSAPSR
jgi:hypothetical protein